MNTLSDKNAAAAELSRQSEVGGGETPAWKWIAPLIAIMVVPLVMSRMGFEPDSGKEFPAGLPAGYDWKLLVVLAIQVLVVGGLLVAGVRDYLRWLPFRVSWSAIPLGLLGCGLWIGICELQIEKQVASAVGLGDWLAVRSSVNPFESFPSTATFVLFLSLRFTCLAVLVPIAEELFLRGFLLRYLCRYEWWKVQMAQLGWWAVGAAAIYGVVTHTGEILAAIAWFGLVTIWVKWSDRFWDAVAIHAVTNFALGLYVMTYQQWHYW